MVATAEAIKQLSIQVVRSVEINVPLEIAFEELLEQVGPANATPDGTSMPMKLEPWPGGRWFRDLGQQNGHFWGHIQAIKRPELLEIAGPLFMSYAAVSNVQFRLVPSETGTLMTLKHSAFGLIDDEHRVGLTTGWESLIERVRSKLLDR